MLEQYKLRPRYDKQFSFMIGKNESQSLKVIMDNAYNVSEILREAINDVAEKIKKNQEKEETKYDIS